MEPSQNTISLKMIPRIDLDRIKAKMSMVRVFMCNHNLIKKRVFGHKAYLTALYFHRKTGLRREKSLRDHHKDSLMQRRSGRAEESVSLKALLCSCVFSDAVIYIFCFEI